MLNTIIETDAPAAVAPPSDPTRPPKKTAVTRNAATKRKATKRKGTKSSAKSTRKAAEEPAAERHNKKAEVIALMKRAKGATLAEIAASSGWQKHTIRGFVSILGSKSGQKIESSKNTTGERVYKILK